ncbi:MAG: DUF3846 domain-containing protein [Ruminococcus sp.]|nr:DUF3846 domain-containing protein [Ruminococcus sp.]
MKAITIKGTIVRLDEIQNDLRTLQMAVDGRIETVGLRDGGVMIVDEESQIKGKPYNTLASLVAGTAIYGIALIVGADEDEFDDVPETYLHLLHCGEV